MKIKISPKLFGKSSAAFARHASPKVSVSKGRVIVSVGGRKIVDVVEGPDREMGRLYALREAEWILSPGSERARDAARKYDMARLTRKR
jgi:hypothetical protein